MSATIPLGTFHGQGLDPNSPAVLKSVGYPSEVAKEIGDSLLNLVFDKGVEEGQFKIVFDQPDIGRSQAVLFRLGEETTLQLPGGKSVKSTFNWNAEANALQATYKNSDNLQWAVNFEFDGSDRIRMVRKTATASSLLHFKRAA